MTGTKSDFIVGNNEKKLEILVGLESVKKNIEKIKAYAVSNKDSSKLNLHMCFMGNPGTGKTKVARIIAGILYENGILPVNKVIEMDRSRLVARYVGQTALKTSCVIDEAMGGVLFIDEAYSLVRGDTGNDYGDEVISTLIKAMEDHRGYFCVILAGHKNEMQELLSTNPGFKSRIQFTLDFPDYTREELAEIARIFIKKKYYEIEDDALQLLLDVTEYYRARPNLANARTVRNITERVIMNQNLRTDEEGNSDNILILGDVQDYIDDENIDLEGTNNKIGF